MRKQAAVKQAAVKQAMGNRHLPNPLRVFFSSYLMLVVWSVFEIGSRWLQLSIVCGWLGAQMYYVSVWWTQFESRKFSVLKSPFALLIVSTMMAQTPGMIFTGLSFWTAEHHQMNEWMNGALEIWSSPFLRLLEWIPPAPSHYLSNAYLAACVTPYVLIFVQVACWYFAIHLRQKYKLQSKQAV